MDEIALGSSRATISDKSSPRNKSLREDIENGRCDKLGTDGRNGILNGTCEGPIGECDDCDKRNPMSRETGPIHANIIENNTVTVQPTYNSNPGDETISFREIHPRDRRRIQELFEEWFPVEYKDEFYDQLCNNRSMGEQTLYTLLATVPIAHGDDNQKIIACLLGCKLSARKLNHASRALLIPGYEGTNKNRIGSTPDSTSELDQAIDELESCGDPSINNSSDDKTDTKGGKEDEGIDGTEVFYIMTLGVIREYRKRGLASYLVERALQDQIVTSPDSYYRDISSEPNTLKMDEENQDVYEEFHATEINNNMFKPICETAYLHVIIQNQAAIHFYEKLGFRRLREIANYYTINEEKHNCYLYAKFFDKESVIERQLRAKGLISYYCYFFSKGILGSSRNKGPLTVLLHRIIVRWATSIWSSVSSYWIFGGREGNRDSALTAAKNK